MRLCADESALAAVIGCAGDALRNTLAGMRPGHADAFGRSFEHALRAPLCAVKVTGALFHTQGGLDIDAQMRVLRGDGTAVPNLYATGEVLGSGALLGNAFVPGMMLTPSLAIGRWLGMTLPVDARRAPSG